MSEQGLTYASTGVSIDAQDDALERIKPLLQSTRRPEVLSEVGNFGGLFALGEYEKPVLVSSTDSVGTKLKVAFMTGRHDTIGFDIVAHCGNDILVQGAEPLFFLDYIGTSRLHPEVIEQIVSGVAAGCREIGCALIGGEIAELPELYTMGEYDLAGTIVGVVEESQLITGSRIAPGDLLVGLGSLGLHTNGFSLARRIVFEVCGYDVDQYIPELSTTIGSELLAYHKSYVKNVLTLRKCCDIKGIAHITGGGLSDNIIRILPPNCCAKVRKGAWEIPPVFPFLQEKGGVDEAEMYHVFNMGVGLVLVLPPNQIDMAIASLRESGESPSLIGEIIHGEKCVQII
ncbi:phosphoribosylformylglycinamidine cyclo-ligase [Candidatus Poribacteria bacterium]|nr:phosphoribosylformylglycinamidine cyclo-ligase [Candidatus Poribacteria bacterium]